MPIMTAFLANGVSAVTSRSNPRIGSGCGIPFGTHTD
jgi:hypothetical protein